MPVRRASRIGLVAGVVLVLSAGSGAAAVTVEDVGHLVVRPASPVIPRGESVRMMAFRCPDRGGSVDLGADGTPGTTDDGCDPAGRASWSIRNRRVARLSQPVGAAVDVHGRMVGMTPVSASLTFADARSTLTLSSTTTVRVVEAQPEVEPVDPGQPPADGAGPASPTERLEVERIDPDGLTEPSEGQVREPIVVRVERCPMGEPTAFLAATGGMAAQAEACLGAVDNAHYVPVESTFPLILDDATLVLIPLVPGSLQLGGTTPGGASASLGVAVMDGRTNGVILQPTLSDGTQGWNATICMHEEGAGPFLPIAPGAVSGIELPTGLPSQLPGLRDCEPLPTGAQVSVHGFGIDVSLDPDDPSRILSPGPATQRGLVIVDVDGVKGGALVIPRRVVTCPAGTLLRGDYDDDRDVDMSDAVQMVNRLFGDVDTGDTPDSAFDVNGDSTVDLSDQVAHLASLFGLTCQ